VVIPLRTFDADTHPCPSAFVSSGTRREWIMKGKALSALAAVAVAVGVLGGLGAAPAGASGSVSVSIG
jgi:hypothetical protein